MPSNAGLALGTMASVFGEHFAQKKQQEHDDEQNRIKLISSLVSAGLQSGSIANPDDAFQYLLDEIGGKAKKDSPAMGMIKRITGATQQASGETTLGGQQRPSTGQASSAGAAPRFLTSQERSTQELTDLRAKGQIQAETVGASERERIGGRQQMADLMMRAEERRLGRPLSEAERDEMLERAQLKAPVPKAPPAEGSEPYDVSLGIQAAQTAKGSPLTPEERQKVVSDVRTRRAEDVKKASAAYGPGQLDERARQIQARSGLPVGAETPEQAIEFRKQAATELQAMEQAQLKKAETPAFAFIRDNEQKADAMDIADSIEIGDQPPDFSRMYGNASRVRAELARRGYPLTKAIQDWQATQRYIASMNGAQQLRFRQAVEAMDGYLDSVEDLAKQWKGGKFAALNSANLIAAKGGAYGPEAAQIATQLETQIADATSDLAVIYRGGGTATSDSLKLAEKNLRSNWSEPVLLSNIALVRNNMKIRKGSMNVGAQGVNGPVVPPPDTSRKITVTDPYGSVHPFDTQEQADTFKKLAHIP